VIEAVISGKVVSGYQLWRAMIFRLRVGRYGIIVIYGYEKGDVPGF